MGLTKQAGRGTDEVPGAAGRAPRRSSPRSRRRRRVPGWSVVSTGLALIVVGPLLALPASFV
ncbi:MAG: hypothetical protein PV358_14340, partial [Acidimicrobiales bacterium]|nr:hypothetical protein [Acidimicrobiales bacterium]